METFTRRAEFSPDAVVPATVKSEDSASQSDRLLANFKEPMLQPVTSHPMLMLRLPSCDVSSDADVETALAIYVEDDKCSISLIWHCFENEVNAHQRFQSTYSALL